MISKAEREKYEAIVHDQLMADDEPDLFVLAQRIVSALWGEPKEREPYPCQRCGTWQCLDCGWIRSNANRFHSGHSCADCGSEYGEMRVVKHRHPRQAVNCKEDADNLLSRGFIQHYPVD